MDTQKNIIKVRAHDAIVGLLYLTSVGLTLIIFFCVSIVKFIKKNPSQKPRFTV